MPSQSPHGYVPVYTVPTYGPGATALSVLSVDAILVVAELHDAMKPIESIEQIVFIN